MSHTASKELARTSAFWQLEFNPGLAEFLMAVIEDRAPQLPPDERSRKIFTDCRRKLQETTEERREQAIEFVTDYLELKNQRVLGMYTDEDFANADFVLTRL